MEPAGRTDEEIMALVSRGETCALTELVLKYEDDMFRFSLYYLKDPDWARDMVQETFLRVFEACGRFDSRKKFRPWLLCIARNLCLNELKRKKALPVATFEAALDVAAQEAISAFHRVPDAPDAGLIAEERSNYLAEALEELDEESRELVLLRYFEKLSASEIGELVGCSAGAARTRLHRALKELRKRHGQRKDIL